ncbi:MAG: 3-phosphoshikimate 1-carboxyvinyltransferase [Clostridia bacterium]|nr:3-phosphoshikimate 1-carboxyvinyltransferase [Clostridia bacterium]
MNLKIFPSKANGEIYAPPSKSLSHRALICGALSSESKLTNVYGSHRSVDVGTTLNCLMHLGADICVHGERVTIGNFNPFNPNTDITLDCNESGSTLRFLIPLCLLCNKKITLTGAPRLFERPLTVYEDICREQGIMFEKNENSLTLCGKLKSGSYRVRGDISSQFITGLLFALPLLDGISILEITGKFESASYVDLTLQTLSAFGIKITRNANRFVILGNQKYKNSQFAVESDCSNAAFLEAFNYLGGNVRVMGINPNTLQGDRVYKDIFKAIGNGNNEFDLSDCPDLAPILFAVAAAKGGAKFVGTARLKIKESDRASAMQSELAKLGVPVTVGENEVIIGKAELKAPREILCGHNDHRIVMSLAVLCTLVGGEIEGAEAVSKSYPNFFDDIEKLQIKLEKK